MLRAPKVQLKAKSLQEIIQEKERINRCALLIQKWYRRWTAMRHYQLLKNLEKIKQQFIFERYLMVDRKTKQDVDTNLRVLIELSKGIDKKRPWIKYPSCVIIEVRDIYDGRRKKPLFTVTHLLNVFGLT